MLDFASSDAVSVVPERGAPTMNTGTNAATSPPFATGSAVPALTGWQHVYSSVLGRELVYGCALREGPAPERPPVPRVEALPVVAPMASPVAHPVATDPEVRLVFLGECPAFELLPVPPLQRLPAGCLYLIPYFLVFLHHVVIDGLSLCVLHSHGFPFPPGDP